MINPTKYPKLMFTLLILASIVFIVNDQIQFQKNQTTESLVSEEKDRAHLLSHDNENVDKLDQEAQNRMGIFHYNEGNKFLKLANWEKAFNNYHMALHHNKNFDEVYINLSTAYLASKQLKSSLNTLNTFKKINPRHPLLHYNLACYYSLTGNVALGLESLKRSIVNGFKNLQTLKTDPDLKNIRSDPQFKKLQESLSTKIS